MPSHWPSSTLQLGRHAVAKTTAAALKLLSPFALGCMMHVAKEKTVDGPDKGH